MSYRQGSHGCVDSPVRVDKMGSKQQIPPSILVQQKIRENATDVQNFLSDLSNWSKEMRATELALSNKPIPDVVSDQSD